MNIEIVGNYARMDSMPSGLRKLLTNFRMVNDRQARQTTVEEEPLYMETGNDKYMTFTGLVPRIKKYCESLGMKCVVKDSRPVPKLPDFSRLTGDLRFAQKETIAAIVSSQQGLVKLPTANGKTHIIALLVELYRGQANIAILSYNSSVHKTINDRVKELSTAKGYILDGTTSMNTSVDYVVCSTKSIHKLPLDWPDIILYDEAHSSAAPVISSALAKFSNVRMFGLTATPEGRSDNSEIVIEALFGPCIMNVKYEQSQAAGVICPIKVWMVPVLAGRDASDMKTDIARDRNGIWRNRARNQVLVDVVNSIPQTEQVLIITNTAEHVFRLRQLLPDFTVVHGGLSDKRYGQFLKWGLVEKGAKGLKKPHVDELADKFAAGEIRGVISTHVWKEGLDFKDLVFLVRADGKRGAIPSIQIGGRLSRTGSDGSKNYGVLIDFDDQFGRVYQGRTADRMRFYSKEGWEVNKGWPNIPQLVTGARG
jgi:superfamily II DNA or RNA helicase